MKKILLLFVFIPIICFGQDTPDFSSEKSVRDYFEKNGVNSIEGIYRYNISGKNSSYKIVVFKDDYTFKGIVMEDSENKAKAGYTKMIFEPAAVPGIFSMKYIKENGNIVNTTATYESGIFKFSYSKSLEAIVF